MKKLIIAFCAILLLVVGYNMWGGDAPHSEEGSVEIEESFGSSIKKSFNKIIPGGSAESERKTLDTNDPHIVVIDSKPVHIEADDVIEKIDSEKDLKNNEALDFARWTLFSDNAKYTTEDKERILQEASKILRGDQAAMLNRDVIMIGKSSDLIELAMTNLTKDMKRDEIENLIREALQRRAEPDIRSAVIEFAATKNIYVK